MNNLLDKIKKLHWVWFWSGNWPLLDCTLQRDKDFEKEFSKIAGINPRISIDFFKDGIITAYHCQEEYNRLEKFFIAKFRKNPDFIKFSIADHSKKTEADLKELQKTSKLNFSEFSNKEISKIFLQARKYFVYNSAIDHYAWYIEKFFIPKLQSIITKYLSALLKPSLLPLYLTTLVTPKKQSAVFIERKAMFNIVKSIKENRSLVGEIKTGKCKTLKYLKNKYPIFFNNVKKHWQKYNWLPVLVNNPPQSLEDIWQEISNLVKNNIVFKIESRRIGDAFDEKMSQKAKRIVVELKLNKNEIKLVDSLRDVAFIRTEDNAVMSWSSYLVMPLYQEIAKRIGINYYQLKEFAPEEVVNYLLSSNKVHLSKVKERLKLSCYVVYKGKREIFTGDKAKNLRKIIDKQIAKTTSVLIDSKSVQGTVANLGKSIGNARVVFSSKDASKIKKGEILIAPATSADFVLAMRKAGAILTELGGITSHAAVVSREFNIPCIVGVNNATKIFRTGDRVEVDANKGIVRKIK